MVRLKSIIQYPYLLQVIFILSLILIIYISVSSFKHSQALTDSSELVVQSYQVQLQLENVLSMLKEAETGQRGFLLTNDTVLLGPYRNAPDKIYRSFIKLKSLTIDNRRQQQNLDTLLQLIQYRLELMSTTLSKVSAEPENKLLLDQYLLHGKIVMDQIRSQINKMDLLEMSYLEQRQEKYDREAIFNPILLFVLVVVSLLVIILSFIKIFYDLRRLKKSNEQLLIINESMRHAEVIGDFFVLYWNQNSGEMVFSDNIYRMLGVTSDAFTPTLESVSGYIHPDDRQWMVSNPELLQENGMVFPQNYRIMRKNGEVRYMMSSGKFFTEQGKKQYIGVNKDITEQHLSNVALEERNLELEKTVRELESFNRVASHDLQEPLRKIQTYISRIQEVADKELSLQTKDYFTRMESSAHRMRVLIDDLLQFSRTNKADEEFAKTDLNQLFENALQVLAPQIEEKKAWIRCDKLPEIKVIPYQIQQLLVNLLGNALKYSKNDVTPEICVRCSKLSKKELPGFIVNQRKRYVRISVSDNGLGFDPQYAGKIFDLFSRLHQKSEYPGTGIGLSICKKIAENHSGYIIAEGEPGIGATFSFFLPE